MAQHSREEILSILKIIPQTSVATQNGSRIRSRMMHFANDNEFNFYLSSLKGDPKTVQILQNSNVSLLVLKYEGDFPAATEVEVTGFAEIVPDVNARDKWFKDVALKSPIVKYMVDTNNTDKLDLIRVSPEIVKFRLASEIVQGIPPTVFEFPQNKSHENDTVLLKRKLKNWSIEARIPFLTASIIPVILGTAIAATTTEINILFFALALIGGASLHLSANILNDYFDHKSGTDGINREFVRPFSGGSRAIQLGLLTPFEVMSGGLFFLIIGALVGTFFTVASGWPIFAIMLVALASVFFYTAPPLSLASRGIGEIVVGLNFGYLSTFGSYFVQTGNLSMESLLTTFVAATPVALLIAAVLYINEFLDFTADKTVGKNNLVIRLGKRKAAIGYALIIVITYTSIILSVAMKVMPIQALLGLLTLPLAIRAIRYALVYHSQTMNLVPANAATINIHLYTGAMLVAGYLISIAPSNTQLLFAAITAIVTGTLIMRVDRQLAAAHKISAGVRQTVS